MSRIKWCSYWYVLFILILVFNSYICTVMFWSLILIALRQKSCNQFYSWYWNSNMTAVVAQKLWLSPFFAINKQNTMHTTPPQNHIAFIMPRPINIDSHHTYDNQWFHCKYSHSKSNDFSSLVIPVPLPFNYSVINPPQLSSACQQSYSSSENTTPDSQASSIPVCTSADPSNTMPPPSTKNGSRNIYGCMVDVFKLTPAQQQQHAILLLQHYH